MNAVKYSGPWGEASGYAQANRNIIQALHESGVDVLTELQTYANHKTDYGAQFELCKTLQNKHSNYEIKVLHITPNVYQKHKEVGKYHIGHLFWETTGLSKNWRWYLHEVREIWTGCEYNKKCFQDAGFTGPIYIFPQPIDTSERTEQKKEIEHARGFVFYSIFQWIERKDPKSLLTAYWKEFEGDENVTLVIKTYGLSFADAQREKIYDDIRNWKKELAQRHYPRVLIIDYLLSTKQVHELHESGDCFVSAHRGEGWGIPQVEALTHKKPVISTGIGGMHEWISDKGMIKVDYSMRPVFNMDFAEQYDAKQQWGQIDMGELQKNMRWVYEHQDEAKKMGEIGYNEVKKVFNFKHVGDIMRQRIDQIYKELV